MNSSRSLTDTSVRRSPGINEVSAPTILVLLAAHNGAEWICDQIQSILAQENVVTFIVINDDGSTDETRNVLQKAFAANPRVNLFPTSPAFGSAGQNFLFLIRSVSIARFDYVAFSDQDDIWFPNKLADAIALLRSNSAVATSSATLARWPNGVTKLIPLDRPATRADYLFEGAGQGCTFLLSRAFYAKIREFFSTNRELTEQIHFHDWTIYALARSWDLCWIFNPEPSMIYRQHASNDTGARRSSHGIRRRLSLVRDGWYAKQVSSIVSICYKAAPEKRLIEEFYKILNAPRSLHRNIRLFLFCLRGGRRRHTDNVVLLVACLVGWL
jgi:rhamnosyltransferase